MINKIYTYFFKKLFLKIIIIIKKNNYKNKIYEYNFQNINFDNEVLLKKLFLSIQDNSEINDEYYFFDWIFIAKKMGGSENVKKIKKYILNWEDTKFRKNTNIWNRVFTSHRFVNLIYNYDVYAASSNEKEKNIFQEIIIQHYLMLNFMLIKTDVNKLSLTELKASLLGGLIFGSNVDNNLYLLKKIILSHVDRNGFHKSYNATTQAHFINNLHEIKNLLLYFKIQIPSELNFQIINMSSLLSALIHKDNSLALFNGSNNIFIQEIFKLIKQAGDVKIKNLRAVNSGIASYSDKNKKIFLDIVKPLNKLINNDLHAGTLSFEVSYNGEKIITNCGSAKKYFSKGPEYLRYSAAHSTLTINNTNISELTENKSYKRVPKNISFNPVDLNDCIVWETSHDGYLKNFQKIIKRKLKIYKDIDLIEGQDEILTTKINSKSDSYSIRFHLMPNCNCLITNNKKSILIKTKLNQSWVFKSNSLLSLEDSIYVGSGKKVEQNKQIVIYGTIKNAKKTENWSLKKS